MSLSVCFVSYCLFCLGMSLSDCSFSVCVRLSFLVCHCLSALCLSGFICLSLSVLCLSVFYVSVCFISVCPCQSLMSLSALAYLCVTFFGMSLLVGLFYFSVYLGMFLSGRSFSVCLSFILVCLCLSDPSLSVFECLFLSLFDCIDMSLSLSVSFVSVCLCLAVLSLFDLCLSVSVSVCMFYRCLCLCPISAYFCMRLSVSVCCIFLCVCRSLNVSICFCVFYNVYIGLF